VRILCDLVDLWMSLGLHYQSVCNDQWSLIDDDLECPHRLNVHYLRVRVVWLTSWSWWWWWRRWRRQLNISIRSLHQETLVDWQKCILVCAHEWAFFSPIE
jgi:hypothetical protein